MKIFIKLVITVVLFISGHAYANVIQSGERITIDSEVLSQQREFQILLPESYQAEPQNTYPVIYLLDGDYNFHSVSGMLDGLANKGELIPEVILVGIADKGTTSYRKNMTPSQQAESFMAFIDKEVKTYVNQHYRTAAHSTLVGHSIGGLFVLNAYLEQPQMMEHFVAISPSVWLSDNAILDKAKEKLPSIATSSTLHIALADEVKMSIYGFVDQLDYQNKLKWQFKQYPDENHNSVGLIALRDALKQIFKGWYIAEKKAEDESPEQTLAQLEAIMAQYKVVQPISGLLVHIMIRQHYRQNKAAQLPAFIERATARFPASKSIFLIKQASFKRHYESPQQALNLLLTHEQEFAHSIDYQKAIAGTYQALNDEAKAKQYYQAALKLAQQQNAGQWQRNIIEANL